MAHRIDDPNSDIEENPLNQLQNRSLLIVDSVEMKETEEKKVIEADEICVKIKGPRISQRWVLALMTCLAMTNLQIMRTCMPLTVTKLATAKKISHNYMKSDGTCPGTLEPTYSNSSSSGTYDWDEYTQGIVLSSFHWGYIITQLPGGLMADKFGGKYTLGLGVLSTAVFTLLTPTVIQLFDSTGLIILRVVMGFCEGTTLPAITTLISAWAPPLERSRIGSMVMSGISLGTVIGNGFSGVLIQYSTIGWPMVFYVFGALGVSWFFAWVLICYNNPSDHPFITEREKKYLQKAMINHIPNNTQPTPWRHLVTSAPMWAFLSGKVGYAWGVHTMNASLPKYLNNVLKVSIHVNGFLMALQYGVSWFVGNVISWPADWLIKSGRASRTNVRKILCATASVIPGIFFIAASYAGCNLETAVILFLIGTGMRGTNYAGVLLNPNDLSPNHAGTLMAIGNTVGCLTGMSAPYVIGVLTPNQTMLEWRPVFWICFAQYCLSTLAFGIWADGEIQYWNELDYQVSQK